MLDINPRSECLGAEQSHASNKGAAEISMLRMDQLISHQKVLWFRQQASLCGVLTQVGCFLKR